MTKTSVLSIFILAFLALILAPTTNAQNLKKIRVGINGNLCEGPSHIALEKGFFKEEGLDAELIRLAPGANFEAIASDKIDASFGLLATLIQPISNGLPIKITSGLHTGCDKILIKPNSNVKQLADLKGKKIGVPSLVSSPIMFARRALSKVGVKVGDKDSEVEFIVFTSAELPLALNKGAIDAISINDPVASIAAKENNLTIILDSAKDQPFADQYCCAAYVSATLAAKDPETAAKFTRAMQKAAAWIHHHPDETTKIQVEKKYVAG
ncbi:MAG: ABC transporter substrate-binding protein, partial [Deltaproteobacteria bacterium]|nr:ABC transporter substrate-binding protein [Deltaproteobacteria bacterium]